MLYNHCRCRRKRKNNVTHHCRNDYCRYFAGTKRIMLPIIVVIIIVVISQEPEEVAEKEHDVGGVPLQHSTEPYYER